MTNCNGKGSPGKKAYEYWKHLPGRAKVILPCNLLVLLALDEDRHQHTGKVYM